MKPLGPTAMKMPGRCRSPGNLSVMSLYRKAARSMKLRQNPVPCTVIAAMVMGKAWMLLICPWSIAAVMRFAAKGAVSRRGDRGRTITGVNMCVGKILDEVMSEACGLLNLENKQKRRYRLPMKTRRTYTVVQMIRYNPVTNPC